MTARARKRALLSSLISATASIAVAFVGVLPRLREQDRDTIAAQQSRIEELARKVSAFEKAFEVGPSDRTPKVRWTVSGRIRGARSEDGQGQFEVYLLAGNKHVYLTGDDGRFEFPDVLPGSYQLVVRGADAGARGLITPYEPSGTLPLEVHGPWADYRAVIQPAPSAVAEARPADAPMTALAAASLPVHKGGLP
jgi:hypothetical protein